MQKICGNFWQSTHLRFVAFAQIRCAALHVLPFRENAKPLPFGSGSQSVSSASPPSSLWGISLSWWPPAGYAFVCSCERDALFRTLLFAYARNVRDVCECAHFCENAAGDWNRERTSWTIIILLQMCWREYTESYELSRWGFGFWCVAASGSVSPTGKYTIYIMRVSNRTANNTANGSPSSTPNRFNQTTSQRSKRTWNSKLRVHIVFAPAWRNCARIVNSSELCLLLTSYYFRMRSFELVIAWRQQL